MHLPCLQFLIYMKYIKHVCKKKCLTWSLQDHSRQSFSEFRSLSDIDSLEAVFCIWDSNALWNRKKSVIMFTHLQAMSDFALMSKIKTIVNCIVSTVTVTGSEGLLHALVNRTANTKVSSISSARKGLTEQVTRFILHHIKFVLLSTKHNLHF